VTRPAPGAAGRSPADADDAPVLPRISDDERAVGWGDDLDDERAVADRRLLDDRPPHWDRD
jgi:hypothetical protein